MSQERSNLREDLRRFSYHTGAPLRCLDPEERCPLLFRDLGLIGMNLLLTGRLARLAGPLSPITYMRSVAYREPYEDYDRIGRLVLLRPLALSPWHSGVDSVYVARAGRMPAADTYGLAPGNVDLTSASGILAHVTNVHEMRECFGGKVYDDMVADTRERIQTLLAEMYHVDEYAEPLRRCLKSLDRSKVDWAREKMGQYSITQADLCCAWNHIPRDRRMRLAESVRSIGACDA